MAFATSNVNAVSVATPVKIYCGTYSGSAGDAAGTITLGGGEVYFAAFQNQDTVGPAEDPDYSVSVSSGTITVTVYNHQNVTRGRFFIVYS